MSGPGSTLATAWLDPAVWDDYGTICASAGLSERGAGFLTLEGPEVLDFLNRLSTNDLRGLEEGRFRTTILTTEKGRMIDLVNVLNMGQRVVLVSGEGNSQGVKSWLEKYIIMENIIITDITPVYRRISLLGPDAVSIMSQFSGSDLSDGEPSAITSMGTRELFIYRNPEWSLPVFDIVGTTAQIESVLKDLSTRSSEQTHAPRAPEVGARAVEILRVESGIPRFDAEINDRLNPLEAGLGRFVSFTKGCYIGQEVIARLDTYKKLQRSIKGFIFPKAYENLSPGMIFSQGAEVGWTTSHVISCAVGTHVALGYLKLIPGSDELRFRRADSAEEIPVKAVDLPFVPPADGGLAAR